MSDLSLNKTSGSSQLRLYFERVLELAVGGSEFPVELDEVWPLAYSQKRDAARQLLTEQFIEGVDYIACQNGKVVKLRELQNGVKVDVHISVSCLEYLIARKVRAVFEVYRQVFHKVTMGTEKLPQDYASALRALADKVEENEKQKKLLEAQQPKVDFFDAVADSKSAVSMGEVAKCLLGRNNLFKYLRENGILMANNLPYQEYIDRGYFRVIEQKYQGKDNMPQVSYKALVYQKGLDFIRKTVRKD